MDTINLTMLNALNTTLIDPQILEKLAYQLWIDTFYNMYIENIWNNVNVWRFISMFSILLIIFYKKRIRFCSCINENMEKDRTLFVNSDLVMTESFLKEFIIELSINESFSKPRYEKIKDYIEYIKKNKYIDSDLKTAQEEVYVGLKALLEFTENHFAQTNIADVLRLCPKARNGNDFNYTKFQSELYDFCNKAELEYSNFRLLVKSKLSL